MLEVCPTCTDTSAHTAAPLADRGINDRLVELRPLVDETRKSNDDNNSNKIPKNIYQICTNCLKFEWCRNVLLLHYLRKCGMHHLTQMLYHCFASFKHSLLDFFKLLDSRLILMLLYDSINLIISGVYQ